MSPADSPGAYQRLPEIPSYETMSLLDRVTNRPMPRKSTADRLETLRRKREQLDAQLRALAAREKQADRKADTRRKVIFGALAREHYDKNPDSEFHRIMFRLLDEYVVRPHDRALFPELVEADADPARNIGDAGSDFIRAGRETGSPPPAP
jgi:hypothetical protein